MILSTLLLDAAAPAAGMGGMGGLIPLLLIFVVFYFFMIRPQNKKQKEIQKARAALKPGDRVVTSGGIYGKLREIKDDSFVVEISENVRVRVEKASVFAAGTDAATSASGEKK